MATAFGIFREEGEFSDNRSELCAIALTSDTASTEVRAQAKKFADEEGLCTSDPIEIFANGSSIEVRIGKMGYGPRQVYFRIEEVPLIS